MVQVQCEAVQDRERAEFRKFFHANDLRRAEIQIRRVLAQINQHGEFRRTVFRQTGRDRAQVALPAAEQDQCPAVLDAYRAGIIGCAHHEDAHHILLRPDAQRDGQYGA